MPSIDEMFATEGPFATVALRLPSAVEDAAEQMQTRWKSARSVLEEAGFGADPLASLDDTISAMEHSDGAALVAIQAPDAPTFVEVLDTELSEDLAVVDTLPRAGVLLESRQRSIPHVVVVADRTGADLIALDGGGNTDIESVEGETLHVHRGHPGGWSQRRFQQRAENRWEDNAREIADSVAGMADRIDARFICLAGDVRAVGFLHEHLPDHLDAITHDLEGQSEELIAEETVRTAADVAARDIRGLLERFAEERSRDRAADGARLTFDALRLGQVETLLVHDDPTDERRGRFERGELWCSASPDDVEGLAPGSSSEEGRLVDIAIHSALQGESEIRFVPDHGGPSEGIGALLRW